MPDKLTPAFALANGQKKGLTVGGRPGASAGRVAAAAQDVVDRADEQALRMRQFFKEGPAVFLEGAQRREDRAMA